MRSRVLFALLALVLVAAACGDDSSDSSAAADGGEQAAAEEADTGSEWVQEEVDEDCVCADGSEFTYWSRTADPDKVVLYYQGGGACFTEEMCSFTDGTYTPTADGEDDPSAADGIFDFSNPDNPFADWSFVFIPYCTGDVHIGNTTQEYSEDLTVEHNGFNNASKGLDHVVENFGDAEEVVVTGSSAGGVPAPLFGALVADELPDAEVSVLSDASGGYPSNPAVNAAIGGLWGTYSVVPDWPVNEGLAEEDWGIPTIFVQAGNHNPDIRFAKYDNAFDEVQEDFSAMAGIGGDRLVEFIDSVSADIEAAGVPLSTYVAPGTDHTILGSPAFYTLEVDGVSFLDWFTRYVNGEDVEDVHCVDCGGPAA
jgi:hypothetical protein